MTQAIVLFAHGARDPEWAQPFEAIRSRVERELPGIPVSVAFLELMSPNLEDAVEALIANGAQQIHVVPVFMARGGHVKHDVPLLLDAVRARHPNVTIALAPAVGEAPAVIDAIAGWVSGLARSASS